MSTRYSRAHLESLNEDQIKSLTKAAIAMSPLCNGHDEPFRHDRSKPEGECEMDSFVMHDTKHDTYHDALNRPLTKAEAEDRKALEADRKAKAKAKKELKELAAKRAAAERMSAYEARKNAAHREESK